MKIKKSMAMVLATALVAGSSLTAAATNSAVGTGTSFDHVDKDIISVTLPTSAQVADVFNYYVDTEDLIKDSGKLIADTTVDVSGNGDRVYFVNSKEDGTKEYTSKSDEVEFKGQNSIPVDISVKAAVESGTKDIALVADEDALEAATTPALLLELTVSVSGNDEKDTKAITKTGATASATIAGVPDNFKVTVEAKDGKDVYTYATIAESEQKPWNGATVQLSGKANDVAVPAGAGAMTAPKVTLTWTVAKHQEGPSVSGGTASAVSGVDFDVTFTKGTAATYTFSGLADGETLSEVQQSAELNGTYNTSSNVTLDGASVKVASGMWGTANAGDTRYLKVTSSTKTYVLRVTIR